MLTLIEAFEITGLSRPMQDQLLQLYGDPDRHYHGLRHLSDMLRWVSRDQPDLPTLLDAILFHDSVYHLTPVSPGFNEAMSLAVYLMSHQDGDSRRTCEVIQAITASAYHTVDQANLGATAQLFLDLDLQSFGQPLDRYLDDDRRVGLELEPVAGHRFTELRRRFLERLLARQQIYYIRTDWEETARTNIQYTLDHLDHS